ncbi:MAG: type V CRISPR-associated protein Cas4 [Candidatus Woesearchaeota archaeon]
MEENIIISNINDFIFCPRSIYFHNLYSNYDEHLYHENPQVEGRIVHNSIDKKQYSTRRDVLQGVEVYSESLGVIGKIDLFDKKEGVLTERKKRISRIYEGYLLQMYAQYFCLTEMGFAVKKIRLYSVMDNKTYEVKIPGDEDLHKLMELLKRMRSFRLEDKSFSQNLKKCEKCIYRNMCDYYADDE